MPGPASASQTESHALERGRSEGLAMAALAIGALSFIQLLGTEKAILAIVLAALALRGARSRRSGWQSWAAIGLGSAYLLIAVVVLVLFHDQLGELIHLLQTLG